MFKFFTKWPPAAFLDARKITFNRIYHHIRSISNFHLNLITKWPPFASVLDTRRSRFIAFRAILDQCTTLFFPKMATGAIFADRVLPKSIENFLPGKSITTSNLKLIGAFRISYGVHKIFFIIFLQNHHFDFFRVLSLWVINGCIEYEINIVH